MAEKKSEEMIEKKTEKKTEKKDHYIVINMGEKGDTEFCYSWLDALSQREISNWCKSQGILLMPEDRLVSNKRARFVSKFGSILKLNGLEGNSRYRIWIDFVVFKNTRNKDITSRLEITAKGRLLKELNLGDITTGNNPYMLEIPYEDTVDGSVELSFQEFSPQGGLWGIWDIVAADSPEFPDKEKLERAVSQKAGKDMMPGEKILERKSKFKKMGKKQEEKNVKEKKDPGKKVDEKEKEIKKIEKENKTENKDKGGISGSDKNKEEIKKEKTEENKNLNKEKKKGKDIRD